MRPTELINLHRTFSKVDARPIAALALSVCFRPMAENRKLSHSAVMGGWKASLLLVFIAGACAPRAAVTTSKETPTARTCSAQGATLDRRGIFGTPMCVRAFADAGRTCSKKSDCAGHCVLDFGLPNVSVSSHPTGSEAQGQCQRDNAQFGCFAVIENGRVTQPICVD